jgi:hypothetical protein
MPRSRSRRKGATSTNGEALLVASSRDREKMAADLQALADRGSRPAKTWPRLVAEGRRFERWLSVRNLDLDQVRRLADRDAYGLPVVPPALVAAYLYDIATDEMKPKTLQNLSTALLGWFRGTGWSVPDRRTPGGAGQLDIIGAVVSNHRFDDVDAHLRTPSRPVVADWIGGITAAIDAAHEDERIAPLWISAMRTFHLVTAWFGFRAGEAATKLRWGWIDDRPDELVITIPGDQTLKYLAEPRELHLPTPDTGPGCQYLDTCAIHQLRRWRQMCTAAGVPTDPQALVFPAVRRMPDARSTPNSEHFWRRRAFVADPVGEAVDAARASGADADALAAVAASAARTHYKRYASFWKDFATAAGFEPRHRFEKVSTHSNRRGAATRMRANGASLPVIAHQLCHEGLDTTPRYLDPTELTAFDPRPLYQHITSHTLPDHRLTDDLLDRDAPPIGTTSMCELGGGDPCDRPFDGFVELDGVMASACSLHRARHHQGLRGHELVGPARSRPLAPGCQVGDLASPCERVPVAHIAVDGTLLSACAAHYWRFRHGTSGAALSAPVRRPRAKVCQVADGDGPCHRKPYKGVSVDGVHTTMCSVHARRWDNGLRDDNLTAHTSDQPRLAELCEITHEDVPCGRDARTPQGCFVDIDGEHLTACNAHYLRYRAGHRGDRLTAPIRNQLARTCELTHDGIHCGRPTAGRVYIDDRELAACNSHMARYRKGRRGDALTRPIRTRSS